jgi:hypothetical protein
MAVVVHVVSAFVVLDALGAIVMDVDGGFWTRSRVVIAGQTFATIRTGRIDTNRIGTTTMTSWPTFHVAFINIYNRKCPNPKK